MKKITIGLVALLSIATQGYTQDNKGYFGVSFGPSIPMGDFASKDIDNEKAGMAITGAVFDISFAYKLGNGNFGISALLRGQANPTDGKVIVDELANEDPAISWTVESDAWSLGGLMFGGYGSFAISEKASFDTRAMIGFLSVSSPELTITGSGPGGTFWLKQGSKSSASFAYLLGAGFKFSLGKRLCLLTNLDYLGLKPEFSNVEITTSDGSRDFDTWSQKMGTLKFSLGIALRI